MYMNGPSGCANLLALSLSQTSFVKKANGNRYPKARRRALMSVFCSFVTRPPRRSEQAQSGLAQPGFRLSRQPMRSSIMAWLNVWMGCTPAPRQAGAGSAKADGRDYRSGKGKAGKFLSERMSKYDEKVRRI